MGIECLGGCGVIRADAEECRNCIPCVQIQLVRFECVCLVLVPFDFKCQICEAFFPRVCLFIHLRIEPGRFSLGLDCVIGENAVAMETIAVITMLVLSRRKNVMPLLGRWYFRLWV